MTSLREKLIEQIGLHTGWEESAVKLVDECILPTIAAQPTAEVEPSCDVVGQIKAYFARKAATPDQKGFEGYPRPPHSVAEELLLDALSALQQKPKRGQ
jgi:hypothetical protein